MHYKIHRLVYIFVRSHNFTIIFMLQQKSFFLYNFYMAGGSCSM
jgi:hypothetical protein